MILAGSTAHPSREGRARPTWPAEADLIISALDAGRAGGIPDRRRVRRVPYRVPAILRLFSDLPDTDPWTLYTRDIDRRGVGFITRHRLPLGYGGMIRLPLPDGDFLEAHCTLLRCREAAPGWYEGALYFNREQELDCIRQVELADPDIADPDPACDAAADVK